MVTHRRSLAVPQVRELSFRYEILRRQAWEQAQASVGGSARVQAARERSTTRVPYQYVRGESSSMPSRDCAPEQADAFVPEEITESAPDPTQREIRPQQMGGTLRALPATRLRLPLRRRRRRKPPESPIEGFLPLIAAKGTSCLHEALVLLHRLPLDFFCPCFMRSGTLCAWYL
jgi:hypothetical protein